MLGPASCMRKSQQPEIIIGVVVSLPKGVFSSKLPFLYFSVLFEARTLVFVSFWHVLILNSARFFCFGKHAGMPGEGQRNLLWLEPVFTSGLPCIVAQNSNHPSVMMCFLSSFLLSREILWTKAQNLALSLCFGQKLSTHFISIVNSFGRECAPCHLSCLLAEISDCASSFVFVWVLPWFVAVYPVRFVVLFSSYRDGPWI